VKQEPVAGDSRVVSSVCLLVMLLHCYAVLIVEIMSAVSAFCKFFSYCVSLIVMCISHIAAQILPSPWTTRVLGE
jgi:hypothetical protein